MDSKQQIRLNVLQALLNARIGDWLFPNALNYRLLDDLVHWVESGDAAQTDWEEIHDKLKSTADKE